MPERDRISEIRARVNAATPGPWTLCDNGTEVMSVHAEPYGPAVLVDTRFFREADNLREREDAAFIAHAREDVPYLLDRITDLLDALGFAQAVIRSGEPWTDTCERVIGGALHPAVS